ncbi:hypothetical protein AB0L59_12015 [Streptomyces sp. NPDC052109]|uniref:hypothetical protein n=1 Tax=Streptomyces sp. NPDC052109 TaxID=3155527 RepID=UPI00344589A8
MTPFDVFTAGPGTTLETGVEGRAEDDAEGEGEDTGTMVGVDAGWAVSVVPIEGW